MEAGGVTTTKEGELERERWEDDKQDNKECFGVIAGRGREEIFGVL